MNIGAKIRLLRKEKRVTQEELAEYLHISSQAISKWETGIHSVKDTINQNSRLRYFHI